MSNELFWAQSPQVLINPENHLDFIPEKEMTFEEQLNAAVRFSIYVSIIICLYRGNFRPLGFVLLVMVGTYIMYKYKENIGAEGFGFGLKFEDDMENGYPKEKIFKDQFSSEYDPRIIKNNAYDSGVKVTDSGDVCSAPTFSNPFTAVTADDLKYAPKKPRACDKDDTIEGVKIKELENQAFEKAVYSTEGSHHLSDKLYNINSYEKYQFYTPPQSSTQYSQNEFAMALFGPGLAKNCKMNINDCVPTYRKDVGINNKTANAGFINNKKSSIDIDMNTEI